MIEKLSNSTKLADPEDLPDADVVIYDGHCHFCQTQVRRLNWFAGGRLAFLSLHDRRVAENYPDLTREELMQRMYVVTTDGRRLGGAEAIRYLSLRLPGLWLAAPLLHIPFSLPVWKSAYGFVARRRYRIAGKAEDCESGECKIHLGE